MKGSTRVALYCAMVLFSIVSMWTTYVSLKDSVLPEPTFTVPLFQGFEWKDCAVFALALSVAIGLMLFALKLAIIDGQKRLNFFGLIGLTIIAAISITFNMDVLYRTADKDFFLRYSDQQMRSTYENYLAEVQGKLATRKEELLKQVARQEGELESEIRGLRQRPAGYGSEARKEDYNLTLLSKQNQVELDAIDTALVAKDEADQLLAGTVSNSLDDIHQLQEKLRVAVKDLGAQAGVPLPPVVKQEQPFMAVFKKLFDFRHVGPMEVLILFLAFLLDLGDIIGYSLVPNKVARVKRPTWATVPEHLGGPEVISQSGGGQRLLVRGGISEMDALPSAKVPEDDLTVPVAHSSGERRRRPFRFRRR